MSFVPSQPSTTPLHVAAQPGSLMPGYLAPPPGIPPQPMPPFAGFPAPNQQGLPQTMPNSGRPPMHNRPPFNRKPNEGYDKRKEYRPHYASDRQTVTVFVGNITEHASDALIRQLLMKCGIVVNWRRVQGADGKLQAFGFCEYSDAEAGLRAIRLLHDLSVGEKNLVVKVDAKTKDMLDEYKKKKATEQASKNNGKGETDELYDPNWHKDEEVKKNISGLLTDNADVLSGKFAGTTTKWKASHSGNEENLEGLGMDKDKKRLISSEIRMFRDAYKDYEKDRRERSRQEKEAEKENMTKDRDVEKEREPKEPSRPRDKGLSQEKEYNNDRPRNDDRSNDRGRSRDRDRNRDDRNTRDDRDQRRGDRRERDLDEEDHFEKRRRERRYKERNQAFVERLKMWEGRERKRHREYDRDLEKDRELESEQSREKKHLLEFLEDYDDEQDDPKYYKGSSFDRRLQARLVEMDSDEKDRQRELEEIEEIKKTLNDRPDRPVAEEEEPMEEEPPAPIQMKPEPEPKPTLQATFKVVESAPKVASPVQQQVEIPKPSSPKPVVHVSTAKPAAQEENHTDQVDADTAAGKKTFVFEMKAKSAVNSSNPNRKKLEAVFNSEEDTTAQQNTKRKLVPLDYSEEEMKAVGNSAAKTAEEKKKSIKLLIERIPTAKDELFAYSLDWECVDQEKPQTRYKKTLIDRRIRPWVNKKIVEYIGEEEPSLVDFMCSKLLARSQPQNILRDVSMVLDDEAEVFVVKMWRLLIYETEAKKIGLVK